MVNIVSKPTQGRNKVVVIGNGKVGLRFCEQMVELDQKQNYELIVFSEEKIPAYDRRAIALYSKHQNQEELLLAPRVWYEKHGIELHLSDRILKIDRTAKQVISSRGEVIDYDHVVLATGSYSFVPPIADIEHPGVHLYRTIDDMERILADVAQCKSVAVIGGGLFGLEAARAVYELGLKTHIVESAPWLMQHQLDVIGATCLKEFIEARGVEVHLGKETTKILHAGERVCGLQFMDNSQLQVDMVIFAAGIRPRDELGRICQLGIHANGGIVVNNHLQTSDPSIFAIGKAAWHPDMMCGLVSPGCQMAEVLARNLTGAVTEFNGIAQAVKRNVMGIDIACFGDQIFSGHDFESVTYRNPAEGIYRKLYINPQGTKILGGILVGDTSDYDFLLGLMNKNETLNCSIDELLRNDRKTRGTQADVPTATPPAIKQGGTT